MNNQFDELTKGLAQSVTRRAALKKFGVGLAGMALACFGLVNNAQAGRGGRYGAPCQTGADCASGYCVPAFPSPFCGCAKDKDCPSHPRGRCDPTTRVCWSGF
jgi:hypothetical protein